MSDSMCCCFFVSLQPKRAKSTTKIPRNSTKRSISSLLNFYCRRRLMRHLGDRDFNVFLAAILDETDPNLKIQPGVQSGYVNSRILSQMIKYCTHRKKDFHTIGECIELHPELATFKRQRDNRKPGVRGNGRAINHE